MTYAQWVAGVAALDITGVKTEKTAPPQRVNDADLPLSYPRIPELSEEVAALTGSHGLTNATVEMVFLMRPMALATSAATFAATLALLDAMTTTYGAAVTTWGLDTWSVRQTVESLDGGTTLYVALVATIEGSF